MPERKVTNTNTTNGLVISVQIETLEDRFGLWCDDCLLPSCCESDLVLMLGGEPSWMKTFWLCVECHRQGWR